MELIVTEKYNAAQRIAAIRSRGKSNRTNVYDVPVFKWDNKRCMGLAGHILETDFPDEYNEWGKVDPAELINADIKTKVSKPDLAKALRSLSSDADSVIIATDYDREGELIGKEAVDIAKQVNPSIDVKRTRFSSLTASDVHSAFNSPEEMDINLAAAAHTRQIIDLRWGASLTRFLTLNTDYDDQLLSVGRVQTPTLKIVVDREHEIENFDPDDYWEVYLVYTAERIEAEAQYYYLNEEDNEATRIWEKPIADAIHRTVSDASEAQVDEVNQYTKSDYPPKPFNTTEFIKAANAIDYEAKQAMTIAEELYDQGYITYPRTDNTVYPDGMDEQAIFNALRSKETFENEIDDLLAQDDLTPKVGDQETTDHPPIHPTENVPKECLDSSHWEIYELIVRRFIATFANEATWGHTRIDLLLQDYPFKSHGKELIEPGYHRFYPYFNNEETEMPRDLEPGDVVTIVDAELAEKQTEPPNRYGQSRLIDQMKELDLGTKSTRHNIIDKLFDRNYVRGSPLQPTSVAETVIDIVSTHAARVSSPEMTAQLEDDMEAIANGDQTLGDVTSESEQILSDIFNNLNSSRVQIQEALDTKLVVEQSDEEPLVVATCPECQQERLIVRETTSGGQFIGCEGYPDCNHTLPLPNKGRVHILDESCADHDLPQIKMIAGKKTHVFGCPQCRKEEAQDTSDRVVGPCPECGDKAGGEVAIKRVQTGSRLLGCTRYPDCEFATPLPKEGELNSLDKSCSTHDTAILELSKESYNEPWEMGCPICE